MFNVLKQYDGRKLRFKAPDQIDWALVQPLREEAMRRHNQSLEVLHSRGGLSVWELYHIVAGVPYQFTLNEPKADRIPDAVIQAWFDSWINPEPHDPLETDT